MKRKTQKLPLPPEGSAFAVPLEDGRYSVCRVLLGASSEKARQWGTNIILVAGSTWIGEEVPPADELALRPILRLSHHSWPDEPNLLWVSSRPPEAFVPIGMIPPTSDEQALACSSFGDWETFVVQPQAQWRWDNERSAVLAEDVVEKNAETERRLKALQEREEYLSRITLERLANHRFFPRWKSYPSTKAIRASRKVMTETVQELIKLGPVATQAERMAVLQQCIESFNQLDEDMQFIETVEREDICNEFEAIVHACGLGAHESLADNWRDW